MFSMPLQPGENLGKVYENSRAGENPSTTFRVFTDLPSNSSRLSPGCKSTENMFYFLILNEKQVTLLIYISISFPTQVSLIKNCARVSCPAYDIMSDYRYPSPLIFSSLKTTFFTFFHLGSSKGYKVLLHLCCPAVAVFLHHKKENSLSNRSDPRTAAHPHSQFY